MKPTVITKRFILCPQCDCGQHEIEHLIQDAPRDFGPWSCRQCNHEFFGTVHPDGSVECRRIRQLPDEVMCLLRFRDLFIVAGPYAGFSRPDSEDFFFHSHQCPENIMRSVLGVCCPEAGEDPHGIFRFVATAPYAGREFTFGTLAELFRHFGTDGRDAYTEWPESDGGVLPWLAKLQREHRAKGKAES